MKTVCESKLSLGVEDCHKHNFMMPVVCLEHAPLPAPVRWTITGQIDGLRGKSRTVYINLTERKTIAVLFDEERFQ